ncbi:hypothetical protein [Nakamurella sp.]|uniref:hypothetical protein n=1 Tax=Nakamurella sp. TaxID=1869182 RepID=UPI003785268C
MANYHQLVNVATLSMGRPDLKLPFDRELITLRSYTITGTPYSIVVARPDAEPQLWEDYLSGALSSYRKYGVERVLEYEKVAPGETTTLFMPIVDPNGAVVGGVRVQGPYQDPDEAHALVEWDGRAGARALRRHLASRVPAGVVEMKTGWVSDDIRAKHILADAIARTPMHAMHLLDIRFALCTVADHAVRRWCASGAQCSEDVRPVAYPDDRYQTAPIWWDRATVPARIEKDHLVSLLDEQVQLGLPYGLAGSRPAAA